MKHAESHVILACPTVARQQRRLLSYVLCRHGPEEDADKPQYPKAYLGRDGDSKLKLLDRGEGKWMFYWMLGYQHLRG